MESLHNEEISFLLSQYHIRDFHDVQFIDSSHGDTDIRHNYIVDKKYVLRMNSANVMTDDRLRELNSLIRSYRSFGMQAPLFISVKENVFVLEYHGQYCYVSEYLDLPLADDVKEFCRSDLIVQRLTFVSRFAQRYKNAHLSETLSMYSLFELSPYDALLGIEEKQDNFNHLIKDLQDIGENSLADKLAEQYAQIRLQLKSVYKALPRCFFQGDENFSNLCVDAQHRIVGLFDFNMSGTEVIANYLANLAFQGNFYYTDEIMSQHSAEEILNMVISSYSKGTEVICRYYDFEPLEYQAYLLYSKIVIIFRWCDQNAFSEYLQGNQFRDKTIRLLELISAQMLQV